jgi:hypothetical protein
MNKILKFHDLAISVCLTWTMLHNGTNWGFACELADAAICCPLLDENYILPWWFFLKIGCSKVGLRLGVVSDCMAPYLLAGRGMIQFFQFMFWKTSFCMAWRHSEWYSVKTKLQQYASSILLPWSCSCYACSFRQLQVVAWFRSFSSCFKKLLIAGSGNI